MKRLIYCEYDRGRFFQIYCENILIYSVAWLVIIIVKEDSCRWLAQIIMNIKPGLRKSCRLSLSFCLSAVLSLSHLSPPVCLSELIQTEFHHVRTLRIMEGVYRRGMQEEVMLEAGVVHTIFPCLDQLLEWHSGFLSELLNRRKEGLMEGSSTNFTVRRIGELLLRQVRQTKWSLN